MNGNGRAFKSLILVCTGVLGAGGGMGFDQFLLRKQMAAIIDSVAQIPVLVEQNRETNRRLDEFQRLLEEERKERKEGDKDNEKRIHILENNSFRHP